MPVSYVICEGEDLVLPSKGLALNRSHFSLVQQADQFGGLLADRYENIKSEGKNIVVEKLGQGRY